MHAKANTFIAAAGCHRRDKADNHGGAKGEDGYLHGATEYPAGIHFIDELLANLRDVVPGK
jgi:hypothetical protein